MGGRAEATNILRVLYRELRPTVNLPQKHVYQTQLWKHIVGLCRNCKEQPASRTQDIQRNLEHTGRSYILYLQGSKEYHRICSHYKGEGERTADETAKMLGFKMPHEPKDPPRQKKAGSKSNANASSPQSVNNSNDSISSSDQRSFST